MINRFYSLAHVQPSSLFVRLWCFLSQVLASYINPRGNIPYDLLIAGEDNHIWLEEDSDGDDIQDGSNSGEPTSGTEAPQALLPSVFPELLAQSCVFATISSYLRNDSGMQLTCSSFF